MDTAQDLSTCRLDRAFIIRRYYEVMRLILLRRTSIGRHCSDL